MQCSLLISLLLPLLLFLVLFKKRKQQPDHLPPSPFKLPIIGNFHQLGRLPHGSLHVLSLKYGPLMLLKFGHAPTLVVSSADMAREITKTHIHFVDVLLQVQKDGSAGFSLTDDHIKALVMDIFGGGTDTTYTSIEWTMAELMRHPKVMRKLQEEVRGVACGQTMVTEDNLPHMNYLKSVIKESLRMHPPLPLLVPRESIEDVKINGYHIHTNTRVMINAWTIGRDPKSWKSPEEFLPERFLPSGSCSHIDFKGHNHELLPFGAGRRGCPGITFATITAELTLANVVYHFEWEMPSGMSIEDLDMTESAGIVVHKKDVLLLVAKPHHY